MFDTVCPLAFYVMYQSGRGFRFAKLYRQFNKSWPTTPYLHQSLCHSCSCSREAGTLCQGREGLWSQPMPRAGGAGGAGGGGQPKHVSKDVKRALVGAQCGVPVQVAFGQPRPLLDELPPINHFLNTNLRLFKVHKVS